MHDQNNKDPEALFSSSNRCRVEGLKKNHDTKQQAARQNTAWSKKPFEDPFANRWRSDRTDPGPSKYPGRLKLGSEFRFNVD